MYIQIIKFDSWVPYGMIQVLSQTTAVEPI